MQQDDPVRGRHREATWREALTPEQLAQLESWSAADPAERAAWEEEVALTRLLNRLPEAAAPSNLTARVLAAIDQETPAPRRFSAAFGFGWLRKLGWIPRLAGVAVLVVAGWVGHHQYQRSQRAELAREVAEVTELAGEVPSVAVLQDFAVIRNLESAAVPDEDLLALLE